MEKNSSASRMQKRHNTEEKRSVPVFVKYGLIALAAIVVIVAGVFIFFKMAGSNVAAVGNEKIGTGEYKFYLTIQKQNMFYYAQSADSSLTEDTFWKSKLSGNKTALEVAKENTLEGIKNIKIQLIKAKESKVSLTSEEIKSIDANIKSKVIDVAEVGGGSRSKANKYLMENYGCSIDDFRNIQIENGIVSKYKSEDIKKLGVTADKIKEYYDKNLDWYKESSERTSGEEAVWARHILIKSDTNGDGNATQEEKDAAKKKAQDLLDKLKAGADFATLAKENSEDTGSAQYGGEYVFGKGKMESNFENAAFSLNPGQITDTLVETSYGYHIIKLEEKYAKDEPASLKCATEYNEYGTSYIEEKLYQAKLDEWKKDKAYDLKKVDSVYNSIS